MRNLVCIVILLTRLNCQAQFNLVPNPSFETYTSCPTAGGQITKATGWSNPTSGGSPDYFNICASVFSVPYCGGTQCFQYAKTGSAYSGIWCYDKTVSNFREYMQTQLTFSLSSGKCYYIGFYSNLANWIGMASNKVGVYVSTNSISLSGPTYLLNYPSQVVSYNDKIVKDTLNWVLTSGIFQASGNEQYITIGDFNTDATTDTITYNPTAPYLAGSYYFIDDVFVIPIDSIAGGLSAFAGNNITINSGDSTFIGQQISNLNCNWYNGTVQIATNTSGLYVKPVTTTTYVVQQNLCGNITNDTVVVTVVPNGIWEFGVGSSEFGVSPNPNTGFFNIEILKKEFDIGSTEIRITNVLGQEIKSEKLYNKRQRINIETINSGIYYLELIQDSRILCVKKIIKE